MYVTSFTDDSCCASIILAAISFRIDRTSILEQIIGEFIHRFFIRNIPRTLMFRRQKRKHLKQGETGMHKHITRNRWKRGSRLPANLHMPPFAKAFHFYDEIDGAQILTWQQSFFYSVHMLKSVISTNRLTKIRASLNLSSILNLDLHWQQHWKGNIFLLHIISVLYICSISNNVDLRNNSSCHVANFWVRACDSVPKSP